MCMPTTTDSVSVLSGVTGVIGCAALAVSAILAAYHRPHTAQGAFMALVCGCIFSWWTCIMLILLIVDALVHAKATTCMPLNDGKVVMACGPATPLVSIVCALCLMLGAAVCSTLTLIPATSSPIMLYVSAGLATTGLASLAVYGLSV